MIQHVGGGPGLPGAVSIRMAERFARRAGCRASLPFDNPLTSATGQRLPWITRRAALLAIAAVAVIAAIAILALGGGFSPKHGASPKGARKTVVQEAAGYLGVSPAEVRSRLRSGQTLAQIAAAKKGSAHGLLEALYASRAAAIRARHLPAAEEAAELQALRRTLSAQVAHQRRRSGLTRGAAAYLGLSEAELSAGLARGKTLAQLAASSPGHSRAGLVSALVQTRRRTIERARSEKLLSAAQAKRSIARLRTRVERQIERPGA